MSISVGQAIWSSVKPIIKIYLIIGVGFLLAKSAILTVEATRTISDIVLTVLLPCLAFNKIVANIEGNDIKSVGIICLTSLLIFGTGVFFAYLVRRLLWVPKQWNGGILAGGMFPNISDLPIAYLQTMDQGFIFSPDEGEKGVASVIIFLAMFLVCLFNLGGFRLIEMDFEYKDEESQITQDEIHSSTMPSLQDSTTNNSNGSNHPVVCSLGDEREKQISNHTSNESSTLSKSASSIQQDDLDVNNNTAIGSSKHEPMNETNDLGLLNGNSKHMDGDEESVLTQESSTTTTTNNSLHTIESSISSIPSIPDTIPSDINNNNNNNTMNNPNLSSTRQRSQPIAFTQNNSSLTQQLTDSSITSGTQLRPIRSLDMRSLPLQNMNDLIREYSNVDQYGNPTPSIQDQTPIESQTMLQRVRSSNLTKILTSDATVSRNDISESGTSLPKWIQKFPLTPLLVFFLKNCLRPCSIAVILSLTIAFIPWVKALFVTTPTTPIINQAPDQQPALSFLMDFTAYVGAASVPFGLILLGATLGRLKLGKLYPGFWKSACVLVFLRQCIMPIFGVLWCDRLVKAGWCNWKDDKMLLFIIALSWDLPTMTTLIYFTASYTPPDVVQPIQMECVSFFLLIQYPLMAISMPFLVTYFLKVQIGI
ncbi:uncharacterized protein NDAI_0F02600 [Naumovozyma dairenensis CBS 421]|uniref:Uncharacterized protein n=1 Tax=Naumovozyma dairenensis (strain ATCC 10597 / BCRC 20456 / CBS 421 / NBRC 0211 / NRRL Y-12639) TaxID=1071378 RepID=G0WCR7_NAUDC|nr:hypothetical protein NDAI_0F02600 [Naumovozyma dairenensis CBS 421]CCD25578.1 hypothetical protein NDAI_0F02600 [Naumovozyma dairenensis CBS 421]